MPELTFDTPAGRYRGHLAEPSTPGPWPGVVIVHESLGLNDDMRAKADRFAGRGYVALAPDLFSAGPKLKCVAATMRSLFTGSGPAFDALDAARGVLAVREDCTGRVGVIGFCMGGGFALLCAPRFDFAASAVNYGQVPKKAAEVLRGACPVVASYGAKDLSLRGAAGKLDRALAQAGVEHDVKEYPGASHSFLSSYEGALGRLARVTGIGHHAPSADDAWRRIDAFFDRHVAGRD